VKHLLYIVVFLLASCGSQKKATQTNARNQPDWVGGKPIESSYYAGIGMAYKTGNADYANIAKNNALNDLASEISVSVSSTSLFYQVEQANQFREEFQANTRLKSKESLEGYELVGTWENNDQYWVYYRLNKYDYDQIKQARQQKAVAQAKQFFEKAEEFKSSGQYAESLKFSTKAFTALRDYLGEPVKTDLHGKEVFLSVEMYSFMQQTLSDITLLPANPKINVMRGEGVSAEMLTYSAFGKMGEPLSNLPLFFYFSEERLKNNQLYTNSQGQASYALGKVTSLNNIAYMQANVNMVALVSEATEDAFVRKLLAKLSGPEAKISMTILKPKVIVNSTELNLDNPMNNQLLASAFRQNFVNNGFELVGKRADADYVLEIKGNTRPGNAQGQFSTASLDASFEFYRGSGELLFERQIQGYKGLQLSYETAGEEAYKNLAIEINRRIFREMRRQVFE
jgi:hypothetical protein